MAQVLILSPSHVAVELAALPPVLESLVPDHQADCPRKKGPGWTTTAWVIGTRSMSSPSRNHSTDFFAPLLSTPWILGGRSNTSSSSLFADRDSPEAPTYV